MTYFKSYGKEKRSCITCGKIIEKPYKYSLEQWSQRKFCSFKCSAENQRIKDGMSNGERYRRKIGRLKRGTPEWLERIRSKTKEAMYKPEINWKLRQPRMSPTIETRKKLSDIHAGKMPKNMWFGSAHYPNIQRGEYNCSKGEMYFRSKWEANYALYLDFLKEQKQILDWEYEAENFIFDKISFGTRSYMPDFKVFSTNGTIEYHEVKGYMDSKSKTKLKRMAKYYPNIKIILIDSPVYNSIKKQLGKLLNFY